jgi:hypothetical protein
MSAQRDDHPTFYILNEFEGIDGQSLETVAGCLYMLLVHHEFLFNRMADDAIMSDDADTAREWKQRADRIREALALTNRWMDNMNPLVRGEIENEGRKLFKKLRRSEP